MVTMLFGRREPTYTARLATSDDSEAVQRLITHAWHVYLRIPPEEMPLHLRSELGWVAQSGDGIGGFMLAEIQPFLIALITAAAVSDNWRVVPYLDAFLPLVEETLRPKGVTALVQIGYAPWLTAILRERGFASRDWVVTYEWHYQPVTVSGNLSVSVRSAHLRDLPALLSLDKRVFGPIWHKPVRNFQEALARAFVFTVAEKDGQIVGYQWCEKHERHGHLTRLAVRPGWEGKGVGSRLLTEALVAMVSAGATWITLNTQESNVRSRILYERHGFRLSDDRVAMLWKDL
jgi:ribosomal-protein-alanine N-acetyltransferase